MRKDSFFISLIMCLMFVVSGLYNALLIDALQKNLPQAESATAPGSFLVFVVLWMLTYLAVSSVEGLASLLDRRPAKKESKTKPADDKGGQ